MKENNFSVNLETHDTQDINDNHVNGTLTVIFRDYDKIIENEPKMVYVSSVNPGEIKGPHLHTKRNSYFVCIHGKVVFIIKDKNGKYSEIESSAEKPVLVKVPKGIASAQINPTNTLLMFNPASKPPGGAERKQVACATLTQALEAGSRASCAAGTHCTPTSSARSGSWPQPGCRTTPRSGIHHVTSR